MSDLQAEDQAAPTQELPRYRCHKEVWALKIKAIDQAPANQERMHPDGDWYIVPEDSGYGRVLVGHDYVTKHKPQPGGYYVVYPSAPIDGGHREPAYVSYSPAAPFESGYSRI